MLFARTFRVSRLALTATLAVVLGMGCGDVQEPGSEPGTLSAEVLAALIVSNPAGSAAAAGAALSFGGPAATGIAYASLPPGSVPNGERIRITNRGTGVEVSAAMTEGGFDPLAVEAAAGDTLDVRIELAGDAGGLVFMAVVPERRPPVVVRTDPPPKKRDVPLNAVLLLVFSEPIDPVTLTDGSVRLSQGGVPVAGTLAFGDTAHLTVTFTPAVPLAGETEYALAVTGVITDLDGEPLDASVVAGFTTASGPPGVSEVYGRLSPVSDPDQHSRYVLHDDGRFELQFETVRWGAFAYSGRYSRWESRIGFTFDDNAGAWWAAGTLQGDSLVVAYNVDMLLSDFEDGVYLRESGSGEAWVSVAPMPGPRWQMGAASLNGLVYVAGGVADDGTGWVAPSEILAYAPATNTWRVVGALIYPVRSPAVVALGDRIYVIGGHRDNPWEPIANLQVFDPATGTVVEGPPLSFGRGGAAAVVLDGKIHIIGGTYQWAPDDWMGERTDSHDVFDPATGSWSSLAPLPFARSGHGAVDLNGKIYVAGGQGEHVLQVYDPATDSWALSFNAPPPRFGTAGAALGGKVYLFGGMEYPECCVGTYPTPTVDRFDPVNGTWDQLMPMVNAREGHAAAVLGGSVYVIGGSPAGAAAALVANERFVPPR
jgi:Bacterial Ig-like domain/Kelch motif